VTCAEFKELVEAYALGALEPQERAACERHLLQAAHEGCLEALRRASGAAAALGEALPPVSPAPSTWPAIAARIDATATAAPRRRASALPWIVAAAALLLLAWTLRDRMQLHDEMRAAQDRVQSQSSERAQCVADLERLRTDARLQQEALALLGQPGTRVVALAPTAATTAARASANVIVRAGDARAFLVGHNLAAPSGRDYELWMIRGEKKIPAGLLRGDATGALVTALDPALLREGLPDAMAVTLESAGGHDQPQGPIVAVGKI
jgi:hypothetical protein